jgi:hypothetical protein
LCSKWIAIGLPIFERHLSPLEFLPEASSKLAGSREELSGVRAFFARKFKQLSTARHRQKNFGAAPRVLGGRLIADRTPRAGLIVTASRV